MSESNLRSLIEFSELIRVLQLTNSQLKNQDLINNSITRQQEMLEITLGRMQIDVNEVQGLSKALSAGLTSIANIEEKLMSWSERFKVLEENSFSLKTKVKALEDHFGSQLSNLKSIHSKENLLIQARLTDNLDTKLKNTNEELQRKIAKVSNDLIAAQREFSNHFEEILAISSNQVKEVQIKTYQVIEKSETQAQVDHAVTIHQNPNAISLQLRIHTLETQFSEFSQFLGHHSRSHSSENYSLKESLEKIDEKSEVHSTVSQKDLKAPVEKPQSDYDLTSEVHRPIKRIESLSPDFEITSLLKKLSALDEDVKEIKKRHSMIQSAAPRLSLLIPSPRARSPDSSSSSDSSPSLPVLANYQQSLEKFQKTLPLLLYKFELEDILLQFSKKLKDTRKNFVEAVDFGPKIFELEQRLNGLWTSQSKNSDRIQALHEQVLAIEQTLSDYQEEALSTITSKTKPLEAKITVIQEQFEHPPAHTPQHRQIEHSPLQNEQYFRSMLLSLRNDIGSLREEFAEIKNLQVNTPMPMDTPMEFVDLQEPLQLHRLQGILKQHDNAIRILASKNFPGKDEETQGKLVEAAVYLSKLEDYRKEMKEILSKQEESKKLSVKDLEVIEDILVSVDSKIGREELGQMAEKDELHKIYRMLKRRIDELAEALRKKTESPQREDAFFLKKKFSTDCASCGQLLQEKQGGRISYESWNKFPEKKSQVYGPGFSRILSSLVPSPSGGLMLMPKSESRTSMDDRTSAKNKNSVKFKTRLVSTRNKTAASKK